MDSFAIVREFHMSSNIGPRAAVSAPRSALSAGLLAGGLLLGVSGDALAHGFAGSRFFPATLTTDDPFVADELSLPTLTKLPNTNDSPATHETDVGVDIAKRLFPNFGVEFGQSWNHQTQTGNGQHEGFSNLEFGMKYQFLLDAEHEAVASIGFNAELGGTGAKRIGADRFTTYSPGLFFGKGFGDLPDSMSWVRPLAVTGLLQYQVPGSAKDSTTVTDPVTGAPSLSFTHHPDQLVWGFAVEYSLIYLQSQVRDVGLPKPLDRMIPLVEFAFQTPTTPGFGTKTTGTINPGVLWAGQYMQVGAEALIPVNHASGSTVGGIVQLHFFLDDLFRGSWLGGPLFGN
jgi:hypothetical protein